MTDDNQACIRCSHVYYDHVTHRAEGDTRTHCRIVRCECEAFAPATVRMADESYCEDLAARYDFVWQK
jgi:hypothetical protein